MRNVRNANRLSITRGEEDGVEKCGAGIVKRDETELIRFETMNFTVENRDKGKERLSFRKKDKNNISY